MTRQDLEERYWSVKFASVPYEVYAFGVDPFTAIRGAREELGDYQLAGALVRPAVYKEWDYGTEHFTNGGQFIKDTSKPCRQCGTPVPFHTHKQELGFCLECSDAFWSDALN